MLDGPEGSAISATWCPLSGINPFCINQDNEQEKKSQVAKKAEIYSMAVRVCVWLGAGDKQSDQARR
jgi:hypothetical protein